MRGGADLISTLPDELLQHVLSFLPPRDAVHSSLLSRRWRNLWKSAPAVRVSGRGDAFRLFVDALLHHRNDASQLRSFEIDDLVIGGPPELIDDDDDENKIDPSVDRWIAHAMTTCRATSLTARFDEEVAVLWRPRYPDAFASQHLTTMRLGLVELAGGLLDFSPCTALLSLALTGCRLIGDALVSASLERLSIIHCDLATGRYTAGGTTTVRISTPSLRHLHIWDSCDGEQTVPSLGSMPRLVTASIRLIGATKMYPGNTHHGCLLLHGLSEATTLELVASTRGMGILRRDLTWCPTYTKLKTLILGCAYDDVTVFLRLLRHTPTLERLILQMDFKSDDAIEEKAQDSYTPSQQLSPTPKNLKTVEIQIRRCQYSDTRDQEVSKLFSDWGIPRSKVSISTEVPGVINVERH